MKKEEFLKDLGTSLNKVDESSKTDLINYYEELIGERLDAGEKEKDIITSLGSVEDIVNKATVDLKVKQMNEKPTLSNGIKALIAILGVLSLPLLFPAAIVILALLFTLAVLLFSFLIVAGSLILVAIVAPIRVIAMMFTAELAVVSGLFVLGLSALIAGISIMLFKVLSEAIKKFIKFSVNKFNDLMNKGDKDAKVK